MWLNKMLTGPLVRYLTRESRNYEPFAVSDPTRAICSTRIAQAFQSIHYPILPNVGQLSEQGGEYCEASVSEVLRIRHHSLFTPRDFDVSAYFRIVKPTVQRGFDYHQLNWEN